MMPSNPLMWNNAARHGVRILQKNDSGLGVMGRIVGPLAFLAGLFLLLPGLLAILDVGSTDIPAWLGRDLVLISLCGGALMAWGGAVIRHRELELNDLEPVRVRIRR